MTENVLIQLSDAMVEAVEKAGQSTVMVNARQRMPASGIAYREDLILTANHVVERDDGSQAMRDIRVVLPDGQDLAATVSGRDPGTDLALLKLEDNEIPPALMSAFPARVGQFVLALGRPTLDGIQASLGAVSLVAGPLRTQLGNTLERFIRTDSIPYPGFSGGPLVAADGTVLGLNTSGLIRNAAITIPADIAWRTAETLAAHGHIRRGYLGIRSQPVELPASARNGSEREQASGLLIVNVERDSPAAKGGLMVGDILVGLNSSPVTDYDELFPLLTGEVVGQSTPVEVLRGGQPITINVVIQER